VSDQFQTSVPPQSLDDERAVLGSILLDPSCLTDVLSVIGPESMYHPAHMLILSACVILANGDVPIDARTLHNDLIRTGDLERAGGPDYLASLMDVVPHAANAIHYAEIVRNLALLRGVIRLGYDLLREGHVAGAEADEVLGRAQSGLAALLRDRAGAICTASWPEAAENLVAEVERVRAGEAEAYLPTGFIDLDFLIGGFRPGQLVIVAGRPGQGKSTWAANVAVDLAGRRTKPVSIMSMEMSQFEVSSTVMSLYAKVPPSAMNDPKSADAEALASMRGAVQCASDVPLWLTCRAGLELADLRAEARRLKQEHGIVLLVVDYLQLVETPKERGRLREQEVAEVSRTLKRIAGELGITVLAMSQLNRGSDSEQREPRLSDLRDSGSQEQDADIVLFLHRPHGSDPTDNAVKVIVAKNRTGSVGNVALAFRKKHRQFCNAERTSKGEVQ